MKKSLLIHRLHLQTTGGRKRAGCLLIIAILLLTLPPLSPVQAASGGLDLTFGNGGFVLTDTSGNPNPLTDLDFAVGTAIQSDGKIVAAGYAVVNGAGQYTAVRYDTNGALDPYFGNGGIARVPVAGNVYAMGLQPDGKILVCGQQGDTFAIVRFTTFGEPDSSFGDGGKAVINFFNFDTEIIEAIPFAVAVQSDLKIILAGYVWTQAAGRQATLVRLNENGILDKSFGILGRQTISFDDSSRSSFVTVNIRKDGKIIAGGFTFGSLGADFAMAQVLSSGQLDTSFGTGGKVITDFFGSSDVINDLEIDSLGRIIAVGSSNQSFAMACYSANGVLDSSFGSNGKVTTSFGGVNERAAAVVLQADSKIVLSGTIQKSTDSRTSDFAVVRYQADGVLDTSFGINGKVMTDFAGSTDRVTGAAIQHAYPYNVRAERLVVVGASRSNSGYSFAVARYLL